MYDVTRRETFTNLQHWLKEVEMYCPGGGKGVVKLLVGNKVDMVTTNTPRAVTADTSARFRSTLTFSHHLLRCCPGGPSGDRGGWRGVGAGKGDALPGSERQDKARHRAGV